MNESIFHIRLRGFELQAERMMDTSLCTRPAAIISSHRQDGTIVSLSAEAREEGLFPGMKVSLARRMSHSAILLPYNRSLYTRLNSYIYTTVSSFTPIVEPTGFGQFYLDMTGMNHIYSSSMQAGTLITRAITDKASVSGVVGISVNKLVSRISTAVVPEQIYAVALGEEARFLAPLNSPVLPTAHQPSVKKIIRFLYLNQVRHIQRVVERPAEAQTLFGPFHRKLSQEARGQDTTMVRPPKLRDHLLEQIVLPVDTNDEDSLRAMVRTLAEQVAFQLRNRQQIAHHVKLEIHYTDGFKSARRGTFTANDDPTVVRACLNLFENANYRRTRVRAVLIDATDFKPFTHQLEIFATLDTKNLALSQALDRIRNKYGSKSVRAAAAMKIAPSELSLSHLSRKRDVIFPTVRNLTQ